MKKVFFAAAAAVLAAACTSNGKISDITTVTGIFNGTEPETVQIVIPDSKIDTTVAVHQGRFAISLPTNVTTAGLIKAEGNNVRFVPDGTPLTVTFNEDEIPTVVSAKPKVSIQTRYEALNKAMNELTEGFQAKLMEAKGLENADEVINSLYDEYSASSEKIFMDVLNENKDNILTTISLGQLHYSLPDETLDSLLGTIGSNVAETPSIKSMKTALEARITTAAGKKFVDFTVGDRKFSDYIGNGKYMLVDFWASWCGPCKREIPNIKNVYEKYHQDNFDVLSVAVWDEHDKTIAAAKELGISWNQIIDAGNVPTDLYGIEGIPCIILFGPDGTIIDRTIRGEAIEAKVAEYVTPVK